MTQLTEDFLKNIKHIHFIGIGGSGMFPLVQILHKEGFLITGSDNNESDTLELERKMGIEIKMGHSPENLAGAELVVYTAAIMSDNPELCAAKEKDIPMAERSVMLGLITRRYSNAVCVCGTHGKTTTTSMITQILLDAGLDPSAVIGGKLASIGGNGRAGKSDTLVCEACEFVDTFLKLAPDVAVILNIDADHLDYFKTMENLIASFRKFAQMTTKALIFNGEDANTLKAVEGLSKPRITFGWNESNDYYPQNIRYRSGVQTDFDLYYRGEKLCSICLHVPGRHNILNAVAACAAALFSGASPENLVRGLGNFRGAGRRFEVLYHENGITVADDYAHHPAELTATLKAAKEMDFKRVWAVFQPFTYSRTAMLLDDFAKALSIADKVVMSEIMGSREKNTYNIYTKDLAAKIDGSVWFDTFEEIAAYVVANAEPGDLIITLGCGDIYKAAKLMIKKYRERS